MATGVQKIRISPI